MGQVREIAFQLRFEIEQEVAELNGRQLSSIHMLLLCELSKAAYFQLTPLTKAFQFQGDTFFFRTVFSPFVSQIKTRVPLNRLNFFSNVNFQIVFQGKFAAMAGKRKESVRSLLVSQAHSCLHCIPEARVTNQGENNTRLFKYK